jgi:hypothetical protein
MIMGPLCSFLQRHTKDSAHLGKDLRVRDCFAALVLLDNLRLLVDGLQACSMSSRTRQESASWDADDALSKLIEVKLQILGGQCKCWNSTRWEKH